LRRRRLLVLLELIENTARAWITPASALMSVCGVGNDQQIALLPCSTD